MSEIRPDDIRACGIVGAGGAGFPTHVKMEAEAEYLLLNAAECEPLLHKDKELLLHRTSHVIEGLRTARRLTGARECVIGIKEKYKDTIARLERELPSDMRIHPLTDTYPSGDEFLLVHDITGRVIPPGGLPIHVGCVVNNVETILNIGLNRPVTHKYLTVAGALDEPVTLCAPIGVSVGEVIAEAGGANIDEYAILLNGAMMGKPCTDPSTPITKTTGGIYLLPKDHFLIRRHTMPLETVNRIGRSACDQCSFCTELCPRYLLGHPIEPHKAMRALGFTQEKATLIVGTSYCCECNICTMIACPEDLDPRNVCIQDKGLVKEMGLKWEQGDREIRAHPMYEYRRTPISRVITKVGLNPYRNVGPLRPKPVSANAVSLPLQQHVGAPCAPVVAAGDRVNLGDLVAEPPAGALGAPIHASIGGKVAAIDPMIVIEA